jgi:hypothetical protein
MKPNFIAGLAAIPVARVSHRMHCRSRPRDGAVGDLTEPAGRQFERKFQRNQALTCCGSAGALLLIPRPSSRPRNQFPCPAGNFPELRLLRNSLRQLAQRLQSLAAKFPTQAEQGICVRGAGNLRSRSREFQGISRPAPFTWVCQLLLQAPVAGGIII